MHEVDSEVDTQGSDLDVLRSAGDALGRVDRFAAEVQDLGALREGNYAGMPSKPEARPSAVA